MGEGRRIALLMGQDIGFCRDLIRGIRAYTVGKSDWSFQDGPPESSVVEAFRRWKPHGIIAQLLTPEIARAAVALGKPLIDTAYVLPNLEVPVVDVDHEAVGRLAAEHFLERGYRHFGFVGSEWAHFSKLREASFRARLTEGNYCVSKRQCRETGEQVCSAGRTRPYLPESQYTFSACYVEYLLRVSGLTEWKRAARRVRRWLLELPKPVGILAANDIPARELADVCLQIGLRVPDDVALLGVDNDDLECGLTSPPLSSVATPARKIGYESAKLLDALMSGSPAPREPMLLPPIGVVTRQSTDALATQDSAVIAALDFIRKRAADDIGVDDVARHAVQGRRMLEYKFREILGHTVLEEIRRVRIRWVKELLCGSDLAMPAIARRCGFSSPQRMAVVFRQATGLTPTEYRQLEQIRGN